MPHLGIPVRLSLVERKRQDRFRTLRAALRRAISQRAQKGQNPGHKEIMESAAELLQHAFKLKEPR